MSDEKSLSEKIDKLDKFIIWDQEEVKKIVKEIAKKNYLFGWESAVDETNEKWREAVLRLKKNLKVNWDSYKNNRLGGTLTEIDEIFGEKLTALTGSEVKHGN